MLLFTHSYWKWKIKIAHGIYPVPAPATAEILKGIPLTNFDVHSELTTPTGAAIAKSLVTEFGPFPAATIHHIGYGAGTKNFDFPKLERFNLQIMRQVMIKYKLECQMDDMTPETLGHFMDTALQNDVLDIYYSPLL